MLALFSASAIADDTATAIPTTKPTSLDRKAIAQDTPPADALTDAQSPPFDAVKVRAEQMTGRPSRILNLDGQVEISREQSAINADTAEYHAIEDLVMANGNVRLRRNNDCYSGDVLQLQMDTGAGYMTNPVYQLEKNNARGYATRVDFIDEDQSVVEQGVYTTCEGTRPDWYLRSSRLDLDTGRDEGEAINGVVYFKEVPILASPWMSFPISNSRRSGFLPPEFNSTTTGGAELMLPYYLDIAPNRDATLLPRYISKRGLQLGGDFRYLDRTYNGIFHGEITPNDQLTDTKRYLVNYLHNQTIFPALSMNVNYNRASDDQYAVDYSHSVTESSQLLLPQTFKLAYGKPWGSAGLLISDYQLLQNNANTNTTKPYQIMPKLFSQLAGTDDIGGVDWSLKTEYAHFLHDTYVNGQRLVVNPQISYPIEGPYYFITPKFLYHLSSYHLDRNFIPGSRTDPTLSVPTFSLDSGLYFDRDTHIFGRKVMQTLEPRLFYVKTPYRKQTNIPLFDTGVIDVNYSQFFLENRFAGQDRVSDANQLTAGLVSRVIEMDGQERIRLAIAQRFSFIQPEVVDVPSYPTSVMEGNKTITTTHSTLPSKSDFIFVASGKLTESTGVEALWQFSESQHNTMRMNYGFRWQPAPMKAINVQYRFQQITQVTPEIMKQIDISAQWPLARRWYGVARANYSIVDQRILDGLVGFEYKQDCWIFRTVIQRFLVPSTAIDITSSANTSFFLQLELNGLSKIGTNPLEVLQRSIPGYQPINQPITQSGY